MTDIFNKTENRLSDIEKRYRDLFKYSIDGICLHEIVYKNGIPIDYRILDSNPKYEQYTKIKKEKAIGSLATELYKVEIAPYLEIYAEVARTGKPTTFETFFRPMNKHFLISVFSPDKNQFATIFRDITEQKTIEKSLLESERRYKSLFHSHHSIMLIIDPESGAIQDANPAAVTYYGWSYEELIQKNISDINILTKMEIQAELENARNDVCNFFNFRHRRADGSVRDVEVYSTPISIQDKQLLYSIIHDQTERKKAEAEKIGLIAKLQEALGEIKTLQGILPICSNCKKIRDDKGYWNRLEAYLQAHSEVQFSHGICPDCMKRLYPDYGEDGGDKR